MKERPETGDWRPEEIARRKSALCLHSPTAYSLQPKASPLRGMTLVELLVVIAIVSILVTTAIPVLAPGGDSRRLREASRGVNSFFAGARSRAIETGRPYGVAIRRLSADTGSVDDNGIGIQLSYVEVPPVYSGLDSSSLVRVGLVTWRTGDDVPPSITASDGFRLLRLQFLRRGVKNNSDGLPPGVDIDLVPGSFLRVGDVVEVGGSRFRLIDGDGNITRAVLRNAGSGEAGFFAQQVSTLWTYALEPFTQNAPVEISLHYDSQGDAIGSPESIDVSTAVLPASMQSRTFWAAPAPYKILRQPVPSTAQPLQLPEGTAIDLQASGFTGGPQLHRPNDAYLTSRFSSEGEVFNDDVMILFSPEGSISRAYFRPDPGTQTSNPVPDNTNVTSTLALLIGRRELMPAEGIARAGLTPAQLRNEPIDLMTYANKMEDEATQETLNKYNWLNPDSRWVVIGAQSGSVATVANAVINPNLNVDGDAYKDADIDRDGSLNLAEQLAAARENATRRNSSGR